MMTSTIDKCKEIHQDERKQNEEKEPRKFSSSKLRDNRNIDSESVKKLNTRPSSGRNNGSSLREIEVKQKEVVKESRLIREPSDLTVSGIKIKLVSLI